MSIERFEFQLLRRDRVRMFDFFRYARIVILAAALCIGGCVGSPGVEAPASTNGFDAGNRTASEDNRAAAGTTGATAPVDTESSTNASGQIKHDEDAGNKGADAQ